MNRILSHKAWLYMEVDMDMNIAKVAQKGMF